MSPYDEIAMYLQGPWTLLRTALRALLPHRREQQRDQLVERWTQQLNEWKAWRKAKRHVHSHSHQPLT